MTACICTTIDPEDREHVYAVKVGFIVYLDPDNLPSEGSLGLKEVAAEHIIDFIKHGAAEDAAWLAEFNIDRVRLIECRSMRLTKE